MTYCLRRATVRDAVYLADNLRPADMEEISAHGLSPEYALLMGLRYGRPAHVAEVGGVPALMCGVTPLPDGAGAVWMMGTAEIERRRVSFLRAARGWVEAVSAAYPLLVNVADARNTVHLRWLRWTGFTLHEDRPVTSQSGHQLIPFTKETRNV
jgi:hypothetical protein